VTLRRLAVALLVVTLLVATWYFLAYLAWWEWNRAVIAGIIVLAAEVGLVALVVLSRIDRLERRRELGRAVRIKAHLDAHPVEPEPFAWLRRPDRLNVFVPVLLGAGLIVSSVAWVVERIARLTSRSGTTESLSRELASLAPPDGGFLDGDDPLELLERPMR
jgi:hypothetical protein